MNTENVIYVHKITEKKKRCKFCGRAIYVASIDAGDRDVCLHCDAMSRISILK